MKHPKGTEWTLGEVRCERIRQDRKWGPQNHPDGTGPQWATLLAEARAACNNDNWAHILREEFYEALVETEPEKIKTELIQVAAVAVAWAEAIDRRISG